MADLRKKAILTAATVVVALMFIIPASGRNRNNPTASGSTLNALARTTGYGIDRPFRRRRIIARRRRLARWHLRRVHRARWRRWHRRD